MADNFGVYDISAALEPTVSQSLAVVHSGLSSSINDRRLTQREKYDRLITGRATRLEVAQFPYDSSYAEAPSWTQYEVGKRHAFVISELSSSQHEVTSLNARFSGTARLENTAVTASGALMYSKSNRFVKFMYKLTASADLPLQSANDTYPSEYENLSRIAVNPFDAVSGSYRNKSYWDPAVFEIDVAEYGKIRDIKVWVEFIHDHRGGTGTGSADASNPFWAGGSGSAQDLRHGLQGMQIALRSPNTDFKYAHPLWNDPTVVDFENSPQYGSVPELLKNSYLLWAGHAVEENLGISLGDLTSSLPSAWNSSNVITGSASNTLDNLTMRLNSDNRPFIAYNHFDEGQMKIYYPKVINSVVTYVKEPAFNTANFGIIYTQLLLGSSSCPHIFFGDDSGILRFSRSSSLGWSASSSIVMSSRLASDEAIDADDKIFVIGSNNAQTQLIASATDGGWQPIKNLSARPSTAVSLFADKSNVFHFSFIEQDDVTPFKYSLYYGTTGSSGLNIQKIEDQTLGSTPTNYTSVAVSQAGIPSIVYSFNANGVKIATSGSAGWKIKSFLSGVATTFSSPKGTQFDNAGNMISLLTINNYRGTNIYDLALMKSSSNGLSLEFLPDSTIVAATVGHIDIDTGGRQHVAHQYLSTFGTVTYMSRSFVDARDGAYHEFDTDIDMRTVFSDSSHVSNPRHLEDLYANASVNSFGPSGIQIERVKKETSYPSPLSASVKQYNYLYFDTPYDQSAWLTGANFPWMLDGRIPPGNFQGRNWSTSSSLGPPPGWLTGPANTAAVNEWPTTGSQIGPTDIKPVYPLLDDIYAEKIFYQSPVTDIVPLSSGTARSLTGFRPGLRGTEVHGKWKLMIGNNASLTGAPPAPAGRQRSGFWFRQLRLEFLLEQGEDSRGASFVSRDRKYKKTSFVTAREGKRLVHIVSGSSTWDIGTNAVYVVQQHEYGRTIGITSDKNDPSFAVYSKITGSLATRLSGSGRLANVEASYLSNEFGTPYIPLSSGSGESPDFDTYSLDEFTRTKAVFNTIFGRNTLIPAQNTLSAHVSRGNVFMTTRDIAAAVVQSSLSSSNG